MGLAGQFVAEREGIPLALLNPINLFLRSTDTFPDGVGVAPSSSRLGRVRNRVANRLLFDLMLRDVNRHLREVRSRLGQPALRSTLMDQPARVSQLILQPTVPDFEYPRADLPRHVHFIGSLLPPGPSDWTPPPWWGRLDEDRPVVLVTQGTVATDFERLLRPAIAALADQDILVVATTGGRPADEIGEQPASVIIEPFVPFAALMPHVDVMVSNGGYGGIHYALAEGVPIIVAGRSEDKVETSARVAWSGVGIDLRTDRADPAKVREAVRRVLHDGCYRERARILQARLADLDGPVVGAQLLERLASLRGPVLRSHDPWSERDPA